MIPPAVILAWLYHGLPQQSYGVPSKLLVGRRGHLRRKLHTRLLHRPDGLAGYHIAFKYSIVRLPECRLSFMHIRDIHVSGYPALTVVDRTRTSRRGSTARSPATPIAARGINSEIRHWSGPHPCMLALQLRLWPHSGIGGKTPAEAAGICLIRRPLTSWRTYYTERRRRDINPQL